ncbi:MAG: TSUP family transporter [Planctomycetota bacterium]
MLLQAILVETHLWGVLAGLGVVAFVAGLVDSIAGGGGLLTVPALLLVGLPPKLALGTNKLQASFGSGSAMVHYARGGTVQPRRLIGPAAWVLLWAGAGSLAVQHLSNDVLAGVIPVLLLALLVYLLAKPAAGMVESAPRMKPAAFYAIFGATIGFYDGFFGPGTGSFWTLALVALLGMDLPRAVGHTKVMNFTSNIAALAWFLVGGWVHVPLGLAMGVGQLLGARVGSTLVLRGGAKIVRPVLLLVVALTAGKLLWDWWSGG